MWIRNLYIDLNGNPYTIDDNNLDEFVTISQKHLLPLSIRCGELKRKGYFKEAKLLQELFLMTYHK